MHSAVLRCVLHLWQPNTLCSEVRYSRGFHPMTAARAALLSIQAETRERRTRWGARREGGEGVVMKVYDGAQVWRRGKFKG